jgi:hypothetical protein
MGIDDYTTPLKPASLQPLIDKCLVLAEGGDYSELVSEAFREAVKTLRKQDEDYYLFQVKPRLKKLKAAPITLSDLEKYTKPPKASKQRYKPLDEGEDSAPRQGKTDLFIQMVQQWASVFNDDSGRSYASFVAEILNPDTGEVSTHNETWALDSKPFRAKASKEFMKRFGMVAGEANVKEGCDILSAFADEVPRQAVYMRFAPIPDVGGIYVDLVNDVWEVVEITPQGWRVIPCSECKVKFRRVQHAKPLPRPVPASERKRSINDLWQHVNIQGQDSQLLTLAWLLEAMRVDTPYPVLELIAGQGSAKSTTQERLRALLDPNAVMLRTEPTSLRDLSISTVSNHIISLNNLSGLTTTQQDFMCSMSTGGGDATRRLYSNDDESTWDIKRPIIMNGINQLVTRPDLADRTINLDLPKIEYRDQSQLDSQWLEDYPQLTGALYDLMVRTLAFLPTVQITKLPRMGDFAKLGVAMCKALRLDKDFVALFNRNRDEVVLRGVESSPVALALLSLIDVRDKYEGTLSDLLNDLGNYAPKHFDKNHWVKSPRGLGELLKRLAPALKVSGIEVEELTRTTRGKPYRIYKIDLPTDTLLAPSV